MKREISVFVLKQKWISNNNNLCRDQEASVNFTWVKQVKDTQKT